MTVKKDHQLLVAANLKNSSVSLVLFYTTEASLSSVEMEFVSTFVEPETFFSL